MTGKPPPLDPWAWYYRLFFGWTFTVLVAIGVALTFGPSEWAASVSLEPLHVYLPSLGFRIIGVGFMVLAGLLCDWRAREYAYLVAGLLGAGFFVLAIWYSLSSGQRTNVILIGVAALGFPSMLSGWRYAKIAADTRHHRT